MALRGNTFGIMIQNHEAVCEHASIWFAIRVDQMFLSDWTNGVVQELNSTSRLSLLV